MGGENKCSVRANMGLPGSTTGKEPTCQCSRCKRCRRDASSVPRLGRCPGGGHGNSLQYSCLGNPMDRRALWAMVHRVAKSQMQLKQLNTQTLKERPSCEDAIWGHKKGNCHAVASIVLTRVTLEAFTARVRNEIRILDITAVQHCAGGSSQCNKTRKRNEA